jgi:hypothetical protein
MIRSPKHCDCHYKTIYVITYLENQTLCCPTAEMFIIFRGRSRVDVNVPVYQLSHAEETRLFLPVRTQLTMLHQPNWPNRVRGPVLLTVSDNNPATCQFS